MTPVLSAFSPRSTCLAIGLMAGVAMLAACSPTNQYMPSRTGYIEPPQQVAASLTSLNYRVELGRGQTALTRAQVDGLNRFLASNGETDGDHIEIRTAAMAGPGRNAAIADTLRGSFLAGGYTPSRVQIVDTPGYGDVVEVTIQRYTVQLPDCSQDVRRDPGMMEWSDEPTNIRKLGCSDQTNLGLMIADPRDLQGGRPTGDAAGYREAEAVKRYRTDKVKELKEVSSKSTGSSSGSSK